MRKKSLTIMANKSIKDNELQDNLNRLKIEKPNPPYLEDYSYSFLQVVGDRFGDYEMIEGSAPENKNEIAITKSVAESFGLEIGDTIEIDFDGTKEKCTVTGMFQCMNGLGNLIRLYDDAPTSLTHYSGSINTQIAFTDNPSWEEIQSRKAKVKDIFNSNKK